MSDLVFMNVNIKIWLVVMFCVMYGMRLLGLNLGWSVLLSLILVELVWVGKDMRRIVKGE